MSSSGSSVYDCGVKLCVLPTFTPPTFFFCLFFFHLFIFICTLSLWKKEGPSIFKRCLVSKLVYSSGYVKVMSIGKVSFVLLLFCVRSFLMHLSTQISSFQTLFSSSPSSSSSLLHHIHLHLCLLFLLLFRLLLLLFFFFFVFPNMSLSQFQIS